MLPFLKLAQLQSPFLESYQKIIVRLVLNNNHTSPIPILINASSIKGTSILLLNAPVVKLSY